MKKLLVLLSFLVSVSASAEVGFKITDTIPLMSGNGEYSAVELDLTNSNHTGANNKIYGMKIPDMTLDGQAIGTAISIGQGWHYGINLTTNLPLSFGPLPGGPMLYYDGTPSNGLSVSDKMTVYGDVSLNNKGLRDFDILDIKVEDLNSSSCTDGQARIDNGGSNVEFCLCVSSEWQCAGLRPGPID